jgi:hypothetical protein
MLPLKQPQLLRDARVKLYKALMITPVERRMATMSNWIHASTLHHLIRNMTDRVQLTL